MIDLTALRAIVMVGLIVAASTVSAQTTFTINSLGDRPAFDTTDGTCSTGFFLPDPPPFILECTMRAAIEQANATSGPVTIEISQTIERSVGTLSIIDIDTPLPFISNEVTIAGETHPEWEYEGATHLVLRGPGGGAFSGLRFSSGAAGSTVRNLGIQDFGNSGILISGGDNYTIESNVLGGAWGVTTYSYIGNGGNGLDISNSSQNQISNNLIPANGAHGVRIRNGSASNVLQGNVIGLRRIGGFGPYQPQLVSGNGGHGILIESSAGSGNAIGFLEGNTISNNDVSGIAIYADDQLVLGNAIGVPHEGEIASGYESANYGNEQHGILVSSSNNVIGTGGGGRNVIGHSQLSGILVASGTSGNEIASNWIGTNADGDDLGMTRGIRTYGAGNNLTISNTIAFNVYGIYIEESGSGGFMRRNTILENGTGVRFHGPGQLGSTDIDDANVIGNNGTGVAVYGSSIGLALIRNNYIGTDASGALLGNGTGLMVSGPDSTVRIGDGSGTGNVIVNSQLSGIDLRQGASEVIIAGNRIGVHSNGQAMGNQTGISFGNGASGSNATGNRVGFQFGDIIDPANWFPGSGLGNVIAHNQQGVSFAHADNNSTGNIIRGNSIHSNGPAGTRGIDLGMEELDVGGAAIGPNNLMNYPDFDAAATQYDAAAAEINYRVRVQTTPANADYPLIIDLYLADGNSPQGMTYIGSHDYPEFAAFEFHNGTISLPQGLPAGVSLVATATDSSGNTSQFTNTPVEMALPASIFSDRFEAP